MRLLVNYKDKENNLDQYIPRIYNRCKDSILVLLELKALVASD
jgi:hypothetical protein